MITFKKEELFNQNLYQIPACTICLQQLSQQIASLSCGHCFHMVCIIQHFQYRGTCPNCQKRASLNEIRGIHFLLNLNTKANVHLRSLLSSLNVVDRTKMQYLLGQMKKQTQDKEKFLNQVVSNQNQLKSRILQIEHLKNELACKKAEMETIRKQNLQFQYQNESLRRNLAQSQRSEAILKAQLDNTKSQLKQLEQFKKYKKIINGSSDELVKLKTQMELNHTLPTEMTKQFFQICQMSKLELGKEKQRIKDFQQQLRLYVQELTRQKETTNRLEKELEKMNERNSLQRKRSIQNEFRYKKLKQKHMNSEDKRDRNTSSSNSNNNEQPKINSSSSSNNLQSAIQGFIKKPTFSGVKFGGFRVSQKK